MRPRGQVREAMREAIARLSMAGGTGATWREAALAANVGFGAARRTVENMARAGELVRIAVTVVDGHRVGLYAPPARATHPDDALAHALRAWR